MPSRPVLLLPMLLCTACWPLQPVVEVDRFELQCSEAGASLAVDLIGLPEDLFHIALEYAPPDGEPRWSLFLSPEPDPEAPDHLSIRGGPYLDPISGEAVCPGLWTLVVEDQAGEQRHTLRIDP